MNRVNMVSVAFIALVLLLPTQSEGRGETNPLHTYVKARDPSYGWTHLATKKTGEVSVHTLLLTSQTWRGRPWKHSLVVIVPRVQAFPETAMLLVSGGANRPGFEKKLPREAVLLSQVAVASGSPVAVLGQVPNQPLFGGKKEDDAISYTFKKFFETGDATWPLLLPMTKSAVRAMDAVQAFLREKHDQKVECFFVTGASKRGWTTWLTTAVDRRVTASAPMVIDMLNLPRQMPHQVACWGTYSEQIREYTVLGLQDMLTSKKGLSLLRSVDPWFHRKRLRAPKLVILGTNDRYWPVDAAQHYFHDLPGIKYLHFVPNAGHGLDLTVVQTLTAFYQALVGDRSLPVFSWRLSRGARPVLHLRTPSPVVTVELWGATSSTRDFRGSTWTVRAKLPGQKASYAFPVPRPSTGSMAVYGALLFRNGRGNSYKLCTEVFVLQP